MEKEIAHKKCYIAHNMLFIQFVDGRSWVITLEEVVDSMVAAQQQRVPDAATPPHVCDFSNSLHCPVCGVAVF